MRRGTLYPTYLPKTSLPLFLLQEGIRPPKRSSSAARRPCGPALRLSGESPPASRTSPGSPPSTRGNAEALSPTCAGAASSAPAGWSAPRTASCTSLCLFSPALLPRPTRVPFSSPAKDAPPVLPSQPLHVAHRPGDKSRSTMRLSHQIGMMPPHSTPTSYPLPAPASRPSLPHPRPPVGPRWWGGRGSDGASFPTVITSRSRTTLSTWAGPSSTPTRRGR